MVAKLLALFAVAASLVVLAFASPAYAATRLVGNPGSNVGDCTVTPCTLNRAFAVASPGDTISIPAGTYTQVAAMPAKAAGTITIQGAGAANTIIQANAAPNTALTPVLQLSPGAATTVNIDGVTIQHGNPTIAGGGIDIVSGTINLTNSVIRNNRVRVASGVAVGGGVAARVGSVFTADNVTFSGNSTQAGSTTAFGAGGGVWGAGRVTVRNSAFINNTAGGDGGGAGNGNTAAGIAMVIEDSTFEGNTAGANGGAVSSTANTRLTLDGVTISSTAPGNRATGTGNNGVGGGVHFAGTALTITDSAINGSTAANNGGGVWTSGPTLSMTRTVISGNRANSASGGGGGLLWAGTSGTITDSDIIGNQAVTGGGVWVFTNGLAIADSTIRDNTGVAGGGLATLGLPALGVPHPSVTIVDSSVSGNHANGTNGGSGGGLYLTAGATLTNVDVDDNEAVYGPDGGDANTQVDNGLAGGIGLFGGTLTATDASIRGNAAFNGGGLLAFPIVGATSVTLTRTSVDANTADADGRTIQTGANNSNDVGGGNGGGIYNLAGTSVTVTNSSVSGNTAIPGPDGGDSGTGVDGGNGGGILTQGTGTPPFPAVSVIRSAVNHNEAGTGSALFNLFSALTVRDSTISENHTDPGLGAVVHFGAATTIAGSTVTENTSAAAIGYGGIVALSTGAGAAGSIVRDNTAPDCTDDAAFPGFFFDVADGGYNATDDPACQFTNLVVTGDPQLGDLALNGGLTENRLPAATSPVINKIPPGTNATFNDAVTGSPIALCPGTDQRNLARPSGPSCDIGSVEVGNVAPELDGNAAPVFLVGTAGSETYTASGVPSPVAITYDGDTLPTGVTFVDNGDGTATLAGTPADATGGTYSFTLTASNGVEPDDTLDVTLTVNEAPEISGPADPTFVEGLPGSSYDYTADGFPTGAALSYSGDVLPTNLTFTDNGDGTATIAGTPDLGTAGDYEITITADNDNGGPIPDGTLDVVVHVNPAVNITTTELPDGTVGSAYSATVEAEDGSPPYSFTITNGALPPGLSLATTGAITGTPTSAGTFEFDVTVEDNIGQTDTQTLSITVQKGVSRLEAEPVVITTVGGVIKITVGRVAATLTGGDANLPIPGQTIAFSAGATPVCTAVTDSFGRATCTAGVLQTLALIANLGVTATYAGNADWLPSSDSAGLL